MKEVPKSCVACQTQLQYFLSAKDYNLGRDKNYTLYKCPHCGTETKMILRDMDWSFAITKSFAEKNSPPLLNFRFSWEYLALDEISIRGKY